MKTSFYISPKPGRAMRLLWQAAGADRQLLEKSTYSDQVKYMCLGGIVLATGIMAAIAGGYAFYTIFEPKGIALQDYVNETYGKGHAASGLVEVIHYPTAIKSIIFGLFWGAIIFNLDRFIVSSSGKGDGTEAITWDEFKGAIPRILMGMIIALTISKPIEIRMFKSEIDAELHNAQMQKQREFIEKIDSIYAGRIKTEQDKIDLWRSEITKKEDEYNKAVNDFNEELNQRPAGSSSGYGPDAKRLEAIKDDRKLDVANITKKNDPLIAECADKLKKIDSEKEKEMSQGATVAAGLDGLLERIKLAHKIAGTTISLFITLLFMAIELTPIFFKMMLIQGPYDYMSDNVKELMKAEMAIQVKHDYYKDKKGIERNLVIYHQAETLIDEKVKWAETQREVNRKAIDKWKERQETEIDRDLSGFIKED